MKFVPAKKCDVGLVFNDVFIFMILTKISEKN